MQILKDLGKYRLGLQKGKDGRSSDGSGGTPPYTKFVSIDSKGVMDLDSVSIHFKGLRESRL